MMELKLKLSEQDLVIQSLTSDIDRLKNIEQDLQSSEETTIHLNSALNEKDKRIEQLRSNIIQLEILLSDARNWETQYMKTNELLLEKEEEQEFGSNKFIEIEKEKEKLIQRTQELQVDLNYEAQERAKAVEEIGRLQEKISELQKELMKYSIDKEMPIIVEQSEQMVQTGKNNDYEEMKQIMDEVIKEQEKIIEKQNQSIQDILAQCKENIEKNSELQLKIDQIQQGNQQYDGILIERENQIEQFEKSLQFAEKIAEDKQQQIQSLSLLLRQKIEFSNEQEFKIKEMTANMNSMNYQINELEKVLNENQEIFQKNTQLEENIRIVYEQLERSQKLNTEQQEIILQKIEKEKINNKEILKLSQYMKNDQSSNNDKNSSNKKFQFETPKQNSCCKEHERQINMLTDQIEPLLKEIELWKLKYKEFENTCTEALSQSQVTFQLQQALEKKEKELKSIQKQAQQLFDIQSKERSQMFLLCVEVDALRKRLNQQENQNN